MERVKPPLDVRDFESVYDHNYEAVARWIRAMGTPSADQEDLIQEVFAIIYRRLASFDGRNLTGWLYRITEHRVRDFRRLAWFRHVLRHRPPTSSEAPSPEPSPLVVLETWEKRQELERLLSKLSLALRTAFVLFEVEGYTADEIAQMQEITVNAVRSRIHRARKILTEVLGRSGKGVWRR